ncbi:hypothetical protein [Pararhizobium sp.]|uniref:hypothetical protein n=1 Tax=Pararhizobium sp. TaxID=1977563 RepID=UPI00271BFF82|nr:hypothetical protein [Pararhizobium sp.]MDO9414789.1 hypothetical protein [Pararhizobium sp.]
MRKLLTIISLLGAAALMAGCNTSDALVPRVDVGDASFQSPPVTQADLDTVSRSQPVVGDVQPVESGRRTAFADPSTANTNQTQAALAGETYVDPAGSLESQAQRLQTGQQPAQTETVEQQPLAEQQQEQTQQAALTKPAGASSGTIRFLPIIGAPVEAVTPLSKQLGTEARARGLKIKSSADPTSDHILKGYFSAFNDGGKTTVTYVWDVLDNSGNRLHRIQGQDSVDATAADLWSAVPPQTMQEIASRTMNDYMSWRQSSGL